MEMVIKGNWSVHTKQRSHLSLVDDDNAVAHINPSGRGICFTFTTLASSPSERGDSVWASFPLSALPPAL